MRATVRGVQAEREALRKDHVELSELAFGNAIDRKRWRWPIC
jgi:hypothetical protein